MWSEAHGNQSVRDSTLQGLNVGLMGSESQRSTLSGSGFIGNCQPRVASNQTPPGAIHIGPLLGTFGTWSENRPLCPNADLCKDQLQGDFTGF